MTLRDILFLATISAMSGWGLLSLFRDFVSGMPGEVRGILATAFSAALFIWMIQQVFDEKDKAR